MPEDIKPPKTVPEMGIHLVYMSRAINTMQKTLEDMRDGSVTRVEFDEHVIWGKQMVDELDTRLTKVEERHMVDDASFMRKVFKGVEGKIAAAVVMLILGAMGYQAYMLFRYNDILKSTTQVNVIDK